MGGVSRYVIDSSAASADCAQHFSGILDAPAATDIVVGEVLIIRGWLAPKISGAAYSLRIEGDSGYIGVFEANTPRPDVATKLGISPLPGHDCFNGFRVQVPTSKVLRIFVNMDGRELLWKSLELQTFEDNLHVACRAILHNGFIVDEVHSDWVRASTEAKRAASSYLCSSIQVLNESSINTCGQLGLKEKAALQRFGEHVARPDALYPLLSGVGAEARRIIPDPLDGSDAKLVGSFFSGANFLVFAGSGGFFYVGQFLHTFDFVYIPSRSICLRLPGSHYNSAHLRALIAAPIDFASRFEVGFFSGNEVTMLINGVSPYHFFYDCLPGLIGFAGDEPRALPHKVRAINGSVYFPIESLVSDSKLIETEATSYAELQNESSLPGAQTLVLAGLSYKFVEKESLLAFDQFIVAQCLKLGVGEKNCAAEERLNACYPVIWVGISEQKRAWLNQDEVLSRFVRRVLELFPHAGFVLDGMTASVYGEVGGDDYFKNDRVVVDRLLASAFDGCVAVPTIGWTSVEKIALAKKCHFFLANYSTGSMYPSRFIGLPGVAHSSKKLFEQVKNIHIHHAVSIVPMDSVEDFEDAATGRVDFVSYKIGEERAVDFTIGALQEAVSFSELEYLF